MKYYAFILAIIMIWTLTAPCNDTRKVSVLTSSHTSSHDVNHDNSSLPHSDSCGPFCICACCSLSVNYQQLNPELTEVDFEDGVYNSLYHFTDPDDIALAVWQPPQLAC